MEGVLRGAPPGQFTGAGGGGAVQAVPPITSILAGEAEEWRYSMRRDMQEVIPGVLLGPYACAKRDKAGITHIVCVRQAQEARFVKPNFPENFQYHIVELSDAQTENIIMHFPSVRNFIDQALTDGGRILMHGNAGISRSGALLIAYMMEKFQLSYNDAFRLVQMRRFCVSPNEGFQAQLLEYEPIYMASKMALASDGGGCGGREKRSAAMDDDDDDDDERASETTEQMASARDPSHFGPGEVYEPLPGHGAYASNQSGRSAPSGDGMES